MLKTYYELENLISGVLANISGFKDVGNVRISYQQDGSPAWEHSDNIISFYLIQRDGIYAEDISKKNVYDSDKDVFKQTSTFTRIVECNISIYGPLSRDVADRIKVLILDEMYKRPLTSERVYPLKPGAPRYLPYMYNDQWWNRTDLTLLFNVESTIELIVPRIKSAEVIIKTDTGEERYVNITS